MDLTEEEYSTFVTRLFKATRKLVPHSDHVCRDCYEKYSGLHK